MRRSRFALGPKPESPSKPKKIKQSQTIQKEDRSTMEKKKAIEEEEEEQYEPIPQLVYNEERAKELRKLPRNELENQYQAALQEYQASLDKLAKILEDRIMSTQ